MNEAEYLGKSMSVADVLAKITKGVEVSPIERLKACNDVVEVFTQISNKIKSI